MKNRAILILISLLLLAGGIYFYQKENLSEEYEDWKIERGRENPKHKKVAINNVTKHIDTTSQFNLWVTGCAHLPHDLSIGRAPISEAIFHSERGPKPFNWDIMLFLGDFCSHPSLPNDFVGELAKTQLSAGKHHRREQIYSLMGNHDAITGDSSSENHWFRTWIDPFGKSNRSGVNTDLRPFPVYGTYERYSFEVGNLLFLMLGDRNDGPEPAGRDTSAKGHPAGRVSKKTFFWWKHMVESNRNKIIITCAHHMLKNTTIATEPYTGIKNGFHGHSTEHDFKGSSYLYFVDDEPDANYFNSYIEEHPGCIDLWLGAHTHISPYDTLNGKTFIAQKNGVTFINAALLGHIKKGTPSSSRLITFQANQPSAKLQVYLHDTLGGPFGFQPDLEQQIELSKKFQTPEDVKKTKKK